MSLLIKILIKELIIFDANTCPAHAKQMPNACKTREQREKIHTTCPALVERIYQKHARRMSSACQTHAKHVKKEKTHIKHM